jgi:hypothetical protein
MTLAPNAGIHLTLTRVIAPAGANGVAVVSTWQADFKQVGVTALDIQTLARHRRLISVNTNRSGGCRLDLIQP